MEQQRKAELIRSLKCRLDADTEGRDRMARLAWLLAHLEEYLDRWCGFLAFDSMSGFLQNDLHVVLTLAVDVIDEEVPALLGCDAFRKKWRDFAATVRKIDKETGKDITEALRRKFDDLKKDVFV